jgi:hypothetical protein
MQIFKALGTASVPYLPKVNTIFRDRALEGRCTCRHPTQHVKSINNSLSTRTCN